MAKGGEARIRFAAFHLLAGEESSKAGGRRVRWRSYFGARLSWSTNSRERKAVFLFCVARKAPHPLLRRKKVAKTVWQHVLLKREIFVPLIIDTQRRARTEACRHHLRS